MSIEKKCPTSSHQLKPSDKHISFSQIQTITLCPRKFMYRYVLKETPQDKSINLILGIILHTQYQAWLTGEEIDVEEELQKLLDNTDVEINWIKTKPEDVQRYSESLSALLASEARPHKLIGVEVPFRIPVDTDLDLLGFIDAVIEEEDGSITGIEFKTAARSYGKEQLGYSHQPTAYIFALKEMFPDRVINFKYLTFLKLKNPKLLLYPVTRTTVNLIELGELIMYQEHMCQYGKFPKFQSWMCNTCEYRNQCKGGQNDPTQFPHGDKYQ